MSHAHQGVAFGISVIRAISLQSWLGVVLAVVIGIWPSADAWAVTVSPTAMTFEAVQGVSNPPTQVLTVSKSNRRQSSWMARENASWLTVSPGVGAITNTATAQVALVVNTAGLAPGVYTATLTITVDRGGSTSVPVTLKVAPATTTGSATSTSGLSTSTMASLTWSPVASANLAGYKVYMGTASGRYGTPLDVGKVTSYAASNLAVGNTYYFVVTSYNTSGAESLPSTEVSKSIY